MIFLLFLPISSYYAIIEMSQIITKIVCVGVYSITINIYILFCVEYS